MRVPALTLFLVLAMLLGLAAEALPLGQSWPDGLRQALERGQIQELLSLDPGDLRAQSAPSSEAFHRWAVLGRTGLGSAEARKLGAALVLGVEARKDPREADCFVPRHGLRVGKFDLVVCFECGKLEVYQDDRRLGQLLMTDHAGQEFSAAIERHDLRWAGWAQGDGWWQASGLRVVSLDGFQASTFGSRLIFRRQVSGSDLAAPVDLVVPRGLAVLIDSTLGQERERFPVGHQDMPGMPFLLTQLRTYGPLTLDVQLDEATDTLLCRGSGEDLDSARRMLQAMSRRPVPETEIALTCQVAPDKASRLAARYRREWVRDHGVLFKTAAPPTAAVPVRELYEGSGQYLGIETRFLVGILGNPDRPVLLQLRQPVRDPEPNLKEKLWASLRGEWVKP